MADAVGRSKPAVPPAATRRWAAYLLGALLLASSARALPQTSDDDPPPAAAPAAPPAAPPAASPAAPPTAPATGVPAPDEGEPSALTDEQRFEQGQTLFEFGDCESVIRVLDDFALGGAVRDEGQVAEAHRMLGVCYFQLGRRPEAERELKQLLYLNPDYELDPFLTPPPVVSLFDELKVLLRVELDKVRKARQARAKKPTGEGTATTVVVERVRSVKATPWITAFIPFGGAQYANGEPVKAVVVAALQIGALLFHGAVFGLLQVVHPQGLIIGDFPPLPLRIDVTGGGQPAPPTIPGGQPVLDFQNAGLQNTVANVLFGTQILTALVVVGVYGGSVVDGLISREDEIVVQETSRTLPPEEGEGAAPAAGSP